MSEDTLNTENYDEFTTKSEVFQFCDIDEIDNVFTLCFIGKLFNKYYKEVFTYEPESEEKYLGTVDEKLNIVINLIQMDKAVINCLRNNYISTDDFLTILDRIIPFLTYDERHGNKINFRMNTTIYELLDDYNIDNDEDEVKHNFVLNFVYEEYDPNIKFEDEYKQYLKFKKENEGMLKIYEKYKKIEDDDKKYTEEIEQSF